MDTRFYNDLINKAGMDEWRAAAFFAGVRAGGHEIFGQSFSWGFAHKELGVTVAKEILEKNYG